MGEKLVEQIKIHLSSFPDHVRDLEEMKKEWSEFKNRFFLAMIAFITFAVGYGVWVGTIQAEHTNLSETVKENAEKQRVVETRINSLEVNNGEIRSRLTSIEVTLQEIKTAILKIQ